jgi:tetratricopeptide (TPR) repeat protein
MRILATLLMAAALTATPALAQVGPNFMAVPSDDEPTMTELDTWFLRLSQAETKGEAAIAETHIQQIWMKSGSDTVDLLMGWAMKAMNEKDFPLALDLLDQVVTMQPDFAEGWNKRATIEYMQDDYGKALADIAHALALEPRHFGAMSGMGMILREIEENEEALAVLRRALEIHPQLENIDTLVKELERKVGQDA